jgi:hypothetical protein
MMLGEFEREAVRVFIALLGLSGPLLKRPYEYTVTRRWNLRMVVSPGRAQL